MINLSVFVCSSNPHIFYVPGWMMAYKKLKMVALFD